MFPPMSREYYNLWYRLDGCDAFLIWYTDEEDGVVVDSDEKALSFQNTEDLLGYAASRGLSVCVEDPLLHDLDVIAEWLGTGDVRSVNCEDFLAAWNLFEDVSRSVGGSFDDNRKLTEKIYEKLFWGNNLPIVTPEGKSYEPIWTKRELKIMREVLGSGLLLFRKKVRSR
jgi:hypothetical protein